MNELSIIVPLFNEEISAGSFCRKLEQVMGGSGIDYEIILVDDGSTDSTIENLGLLEGKIVLLHHDNNRGYGAALKTGIRNSNFDTICIIDGDSTYPAEVIPSLFAGMQGADMVIGSRDRLNIPWLRKPAKWFLRQLAEYIAGCRIPDLNSGLRIFRKADALKFFPILPDGFSFTTTITLGMLTNGFNLRYIPIHYGSREGRSKIRPFPHLLAFLVLIIRTSLYFNPLKICMPFSLLLVLTAVGMFVYNLLWQPVAHYAIALIFFIASVQVLATGILADLIQKRNHVF